RITSEMLIKVAKRGIPVIISRSAPTSLSVELARELNITVVGFARGEKMNIYSSFPSLNF
ncbi:MAG: sulfurtransferase FdhD, partial [Tissierellia bacterium]|nr:sulfurtransferase FdhD [Tissierellia bacterium]